MAYIPLKILQEKNNRYKFYNLYLLQTIPEKLIKNDLLSPKRQLFYSQDIFIQFKTKNTCISQIRLYALLEL